MYHDQYQPQEWLLWDKEANFSKKGSPSLLAELFLALRMIDVFQPI